MYIHSRKRIRKVYKALLDRLPTTYPQARLVVHSSTQKLREYYTKTEGKESGDPPCAYCDVEGWTIHVPVDLDFSFRGTMPRRFAEIMLHEIGHLYVHQKYGEEDPRWDDHETAEKYADRFAARWIKRIDKEDFFKNL